jgi:hypothetical protein
MKRGILVGLALAAGCASSSTNNGDAGPGMDYAPPYVGAWTAAVTITLDGQSVSGQADLPIQETSTNLIALEGLCSTSTYGGQAVTADTSASGFTVLATSCSYSDTTDCAAGDIGLSVTGGSGTLSNGTLSGSIEGSLSCGSVSAGYSLTFTSSTKGAYGTDRAANHPTAVLGAALRQRE